MHLKNLTAAEDLPRSGSVRGISPEHEYCALGHCGQTNVSQSELVLRENKLGNKKLPLLGEAINYANWILEFACVEL